MADTPPEYYRSLRVSSIQEAFQNLDSPANLDCLMQRTQSSVSRNFVLDFSDDSAWVAFDLAADSITTLLKAGRPKDSSTRWINIWFPVHHRPVLETLAKHYDFSPRLLGLMCSDPRKPLRPAELGQYSKVSHVAWPRKKRRLTSVSEMEKGSELSNQSSVSSFSSVLGGNLYSIIDEVWHYSSVDFGRSYLCLGYNSLYGTKHSGASNVGEQDGYLPHCKRVWTWLLLCSDNTVITINEDPFPYTDGRLDVFEQRVLAETRRNLANVFRSLSIVDAGPLSLQNPMTLLPIRKRLGNTVEETVHRDTDAPGLLFYYLFENWHNSYTLVTRKESRYGVELGSLRKEMFDCPQLCHIDRLDRIDCELGVLRRHYESYLRIIDRVIQPQEASPASLQGSHITSKGSQASFDTVIRAPKMTEDDTMLGVSMSSAARVRFERLKDLITLYALSEVEEYLKQKESLVAMNFNLVAIKQSKYVERLTIVALLIAKATILFLPVSLMSGYFSISLVNTEYTVAEYWIAFAVILFVSWVALFVFGLFSGTMETLSFFKPGWRAVSKAWKSTVEYVRRTMV